MIYWALLLHFYQPPTQLHPVLDKICQEAYRPLIRVFRRHPHAHATFNVNGCLLEMFHDHGKDDILRGLRELQVKGQVEFTGSGQYHPILPLIPREEIERQIQGNARDLKSYLGAGSTPRGFFPPEMAYSPEVDATVLKTGHQWIILSGIANHTQWPVDVIPEKEVNGERLAIFFRDDIWSNKISFEKTRGRQFIANLLQLYGDRDMAYVITAMDAETFGHHIHGWDKMFLAEAFAELDALGTNQIRAVSISQLLELFPRGPLVEPRASSWSTSEHDIQVGNPFPLWQDKGNEVHRFQWEHLKLCLELNRVAQRWAQTSPARDHAAAARAALDRAFHSCQFWWASRRPMWDTNLILWGLEEQWRVVVNAHKAITSSAAPPEVKKELYYKVVAARDLRNKIEDYLIL